jgi:hypothetical protein
MVCSLVEQIDHPPDDLGSAVVALHRAELASCDGEHSRH